MKITEELLDKMRQEGDIKSDKLIVSLLENKQQKQLFEVLGQLKTNADLTQNFPTIFEDYFSQISPIPTWANIDLLKKASVFFEKHHESILSMLGFYALPYCYTAEYGVKVLAQTQRLENDTFRRLTETAKFVVDVLEKGAFEAEGKAIVSSIKVRLMHAVVRYRLQKSTAWNQEKWGIPVNQEDLAGTNLAFSLITLRGMRKIGYRILPEETESFLHLWKVIGYLMGVVPTLLSDNGKELFWLDKKISNRNFRPSEEGKMLSKSLLNVLKAQISQKFHPDFAQTYMRFLLGKKVADILDVPKSNWTQSILFALKTQNTIKNFSKKENKEFQKVLYKSLEEAKVDFMPDI